MDLAPIALTAGAYALALRLRAVPAVVTAAAAIVPLLPTLHIPLDAYVRDTQPLLALLGPAIVALAVPLARRRDALVRSAPVVAAAVSAGTIASTVATIVAGHLVGLPAPVIDALAPRTATAPVAAAIAERTGGDPHLAAAASILGAVAVIAVAPWLFRREGHTTGLALGTAAHGIGTATALRRGDESGAYASIAMALGAVAATVVTPLAILVFGR